MLLDTVAFLCIYTKYNNSSTNSALNGNELVIQYLSRNFLCKWKAVDDVLKFMISEMYLWSKAK